MKTESTKQKYARILDFDVTNKLLTRLWSKIDVRGPNECWPWKASLNSPGCYGRFSIGNRTIPASRAVWVVTRGPLAPGEVVRHECDCKQCCNPAHLRAGSQGKNMVDAFARGLSRFKLTPSDVIDIVMLKSERSSRDLAKMFGVGKDTINGIIRGRNWSYITGIGDKVYA